MSLTLRLGKRGRFSKVSEGQVIGIQKLIMNPMVMRDMVETILRAIETLVPLSFKRGKEW